MFNKNFFYPESKFGGYTNVDGTCAFYLRVNALLKPEFQVLDVGCGRGEYQDDSVEIRSALRVLNNKVAKVVGIDVDEAGAENPYIDEFHMIDSNVWPVDDQSVDLIVADWVLEHISDPVLFFSEVNRVLRPGGYFCARTTNRWHYFAIVASLIPNKFHSKVLKHAQKKRKEEDVFPTVYKCNTRTSLKKYLNGAGLDSVVYNHEAEPSYLDFSGIFYFFGVLYQKFAPQFLKSAVFVYSRKPKTD